MFPHLEGIILDHHLSDHHMILLKRWCLNMVIHHFDCFHSLFLVDEFQRVVEDSWMNDGIIVARVLEKTKMLLD